MVLQHLVKQPDVTTSNTPLVILLHGVGSNEQDLFNYASRLPRNFLVIAVRAPYTIKESRYSWYQVDFSGANPVINAKQEEASRHLIIQFITELKQQYLFDNTQVYLFGFSQGAVMASGVALTRPDLVHGLALLSGRILDEIKPLVASKEKLSGLKIFISHGSYDITLKIYYARASVAYLKSLGINPTYKEYTEGHKINKEMIDDLVSWLNGA